MVTRRSLPIDVAPQPGEILESWLGTMAAFADTSFGHFARYLGVSTSYADARRPGPSVYLTEKELTSIASSTGVEPDLIRDMTLVRYDGHLVSIDTSAHRLWWSSWDTRRTRFCPACLTASGGRWQLCWRLPWVFVCDVHHCLLEDVCPACGKAQLVAPSWLPSIRIPALRYCKWSTRHYEPRIWCAGNLAAAPVTPLAADDPLIVTQARLTAVLAQKEAAFGVYAPSLSATSLQVLADLKKLSAHMLASIDLGGLDDFLGVSARNSLQFRLDALGLNPRDWGRPSTFSSQAPAVITGAGIALALAVLDSTSVRGAGDRLRSVIGCRKDLRFGPVSPALDAVKLSAVRELHCVTNQLRYRTWGTFPRYPRTDGAPDYVATESVPTAFWRDWSLRLVARHNTRLDTLCSALSPLLLIVGSRVSLDDACQLLGGAVRHGDLKSIISELHRNALWPNIAEALTRLAEYLVAQPSPIDYQRRRELSYEALLPPPRWSEICKCGDLGRPEAGMHEFARTWLFERVSGQPSQLSPFDEIREPEKRWGHRFFDLLNREVITQLDGEAIQFLHEHNIIGEPVRWSPPLSLVSDLELPGPDPAKVAVSDLRAALVIDGMTISAAAQHFGFSLPFFRLLLEQYPIEAPRIYDIRRLRAMLTPETLRLLYQHDGLTRFAAAPIRVSPDAAAKPAHERSTNINRGGPGQRLNIDPAWLCVEYIEERRTLADIAAMIKVSPKTVAKLAHEYNIDIRRGRPGPRFNIDPAWLRRQYIEERRTLKDIAAMIGCSQATVNHYIARYGLPASRDSPTPSALPPHVIRELRPNRRYPEIDPAWLRAEHHDKRRALTDIAVQLGIPHWILRSRAKEYGIRVVRHGTPHPLAGRRPRPGGQPSRGR
ncbi:TniQ family protein [Mycobacteroides abscessus]|uniref:TniQ family protein n=1 Tax=Mycobacteroides abscessus TaxID=36809 RepID=UPI000E69A54E|nr:TniQ family protein [Mycobacteroides abscessus]RIS61321.1 hypothetical protein D2E46_19685 [Mycobacteroides abscessus]